MKRTFIAGAIALTLSSQVFAGEQNWQKRQDKAVAIGMGSGAVAGAMVAGPIGAAVGGIIGAMLGNDTVQKGQLQAKTDALEKSQDSLFAMRDQMSKLQQEARITRVAFNEVSEPKVLALQSSVQFKTASSAIEPAFNEQLALIAAALKDAPALTVRLTGYADNRGDADYNAQLSMARAQQVKSHLINQGVSEKQILTLAKGEELAQGQSFEETVFDRRVVIQISAGNEALTARR